MHIHHLIPREDNLTGEQARGGGPINRETNKFKLTAGQLT